MTGMLQQQQHAQQHAAAEREKQREEDRKRCEEREIRREKERREMYSLLGFVQYQGATQPLVQVLLLTPHDIRTLFELTALISVCSPSSLALLPPCLALGTHQPVAFQRRLRKCLSPSM